MCFEMTDSGSVPEARFCINYPPLERKNGLIIGDFNCPLIDWNNLSATGELDSQCLNTVLDTNLVQHIRNPTRIIPGQTPSVLDLVLTSGDDVSNIDYFDPIGSSDHSTLSFV